MKIIHFSDPHAGGPAEDWLAYIDKRWVGVFNYAFRRRFRHDLGRLRKAVDYILASPPDLAVCTGDLTSTGQPGEFAKVLPVLEPLIQSEIPFVYMPGNHDCYVRRPKCVQAVNDAFFMLNRGKIRFGELPVKMNGPCGSELLLLNTSRPSNLLCSWGFVPAEDSGKILDFCNEPKKGIRILIGHYPMFENHPWLRVRHRLFGQRDIAALIESGSIDLSLCGHVHKPNLKIREDGRGECCAGSVTLNAAMTEITYSQTQDKFEFRRISLD